MNTPTKSPAKKRNRSASPTLERAPRQSYDPEKTPKKGDEGTVQTRVNPARAPPRKKRKQHPDSDSDSDSDPYYQSYTRHVVGTDDGFIGPRL